MSNERNMLLWKQWLSTRPEAVAKIGHGLLPWLCYRSNENRGHYCLLLIQEPPEGQDTPITVMVRHLGDSFLPGFNVIDVDPETLMLCGCVSEEKPS